MRQITLRFAGLWAQELCPRVRPAFVLLDEEKGMEETAKIWGALEEARYESEVVEDEDRKK